MKRSWSCRIWILIGACLPLQAAVACHGKPAGQTTTEALPITAAAPTPSGVAPDPVAATDEVPNVSLDPDAEDSRPPSEVTHPENNVKFEPLLTPKHRRHPKNRPDILKATLAEGFCYDMYTVCTQQSPRRCTSAPYSLNCGVTGLIPTGDWATCVCK